jgi:cell division septation protein DedD
VQSVHNRFFAADPEPERAPKPPAQQAPRYRNDDFAAHDYAEDDRPPVRAARPKPAPAPVSARNANYDDGGDYRWDSFDQPQPAPEAVRPFPPAKLGANDDMDADYFADEDEFEGEDDYVEPKKSGSKKLMAAVLVGAVVTGGGLAYMYKSQSGGYADSGEPPIMTADTRPIKERPAEPGGRDFPNGGKLIYERLGEPQASPDEPTRVAAGGERQGDGAIPGVVTTGASGTLEERIQNALRDAKKQEAPSEPITTANTTSIDAPRSVQTQIFRPDGSVDAVRSQEPARGVEASRGVQRRAAPPTTPAVEEEVQQPYASLASGPVTPAARPNTREAALATSAQPAARAAAPGRGAELTPAAAPISSSGEPGMFVQIAARNDQAAAMAAFADLQQKYAGVLGNHSPSVRKVDLGEKGVWYRLLVGPMPSKPDADKLCEDLKAAGMKGCFSRKE